MIQLGRIDRADQEGLLKPEHIARSIFVWCEDCGAMVSSPDGETLDEKGNVIIPKTREAYVQHTIEAWNRRA